MNMHEVKEREVRRVDIPAEDDPKTLSGSAVIAVSNGTLNGGAATLDERALVSIFEKLQEEVRRGRACGTLTTIRESLMSRHGVTEVNPPLQVVTHLWEGLALVRTPKELRLEGTYRLLRTQFTAAFLGSLALGVTTPEEREILKDDRRSDYRSLHREVFRRMGGQLATRVQARLVFATGEGDFDVADPTRIVGVQDVCIDLLPVEAKDAPC